MEDYLEINDEECRRIEGFSRYVISRTARIYRTEPLTKMERRVLEDFPFTRYFKKVQTKLETFKGRNPTLRCQLANNQGIFTCKTVKHLVFHAYSNYKRSKKFNIELIDGNPENCNFDNIRRIRRKGTYCKLTTVDVKQIRRLLQLDYSGESIAKIYEISSMQISRIKHGENWNRGKRFTPKPTAPFNINEGRISRIIMSFNYERVGDPDIFRIFTIKRNPKDTTKNTMIGIVQGYKFKKQHTNISRARSLVYELNKYFFTDGIASRTAEKIKTLMLNNNAKDVEELWAIRRFNKNQTK